MTEIRTFVINHLYNDNGLDERPDGSFIFHLISHPIYHLLMS